MALELDSQDIVRMLQEAAVLLKESCDLLSRLDSATGDGDHGATMGRIADAILESLAAGGAPGVQALVEAVGWSVLSVDGGSASPLVGSFLLGMAEGSPAAEKVNREQLAAAFEAGLARFRAQTPAQPGDKTMLDALAPAVDGIRDAVRRNLSIEEVVATGAEAARQGAESTRPMQAKFGRARNLGPRSVGFHDPGAFSIALLFTGFENAFARKH